MSVSIRATSDESKAQVVRRRLKLGRKDGKSGKMTGGLGFWGAMDAKNNKGVK